MKKLSLKSLEVTSFVTREQMVIKAGAAAAPGGVGVGVGVGVVGRGETIGEPVCTLDTLDAGCR